MRTLLLFVAVLGVGCGGLDPQFAGTWTGSLVVTLRASGIQPVVQSVDGAHLVVEEASGGMDLRVCTDMASKLHFEGAGGHATWAGIQSCPVPTQGCPTASLIFRSGTATLASGRLDADASGDAAQCGNTYSFAYEYSGTK